MIFHEWLPTAVIGALLGLHWIGIRKTSETTKEDIIKHDAEFSLRLDRQLDLIKANQLKKLDTEVHLLLCRNSMLETKLAFQEMLKKEFSTLSDKIDDLERHVKKSNGEYDGQMDRRK